MVKPKEKRVSRFFSSVLDCLSRKKQENSGGKKKIESSSKDVINTDKLKTSGDEKLVNIEDLSGGDADVSVLCHVKFQNQTVNNENLYEGEDVPSESRNESSKTVGNESEISPESGVNSNNQSSSTQPPTCTIQTITENHETNSVESPEKCVSQTIFYAHDIIVEETGGDIIKCDESFKFGDSVLEPTRNTCCENTTMPTSSKDEALIIITKSNENSMDDSFGDLANYEVLNIGDKSKQNVVSVVPEDSPESNPDKVEGQDCKSSNEIDEEQMREMKLTVSCPRTEPLYPEECPAISDFPTQHVADLPCHETGAGMEPLESSAECEKLTHFREPAVVDNPPEEGVKDSKDLFNKQEAIESNEEHFCGDSIVEQKTVINSLPDITSKKGDAEQLVEGVNDTQDHPSCFQPPESQKVDQIWKEHVRSKFTYSDVDKTAEKDVCEHPCTDGTSQEIRNFQVMNLGNSEFEKTTGRTTYFQSEMESSFETQWTAASPSTEADTFQVESNVMTAGTDALIKEQYSGPYSTGFNPPPQPIHQSMYSYVPTQSQPYANPYESNESCFNPHSPDPTSHLVDSMGAANMYEHNAYQGPGYSCDNDWSYYPWKPIGGDSIPDCSYGIPDGTLTFNQIQSCTVEGGFEMIPGNIPTEHSVEFGTDPDLFMVENESNLFPDEGPISPSLQNMMVSQTNENCSPFARDLGIHSVFDSSSLARCSDDGISESHDFVQLSQLNEETFSTSTYEHYIEHEKRMNTVNLALTEALRREDNLNNPINIFGSTTDRSTCVPGSFPLGPSIQMARPEGSSTSKYSNCNSRNYGGKTGKWQNQAHYGPLQFLDSSIIQNEVYTGESLSFNPSAKRRNRKRRNKKQPNTNSQEYYPTSSSTWSQSNTATHTTDTSGSNVVVPASHCLTNQMNQIKDNAHSTTEPSTSTQPTTTATGGRRKRRNRNKGSKPKLLP